MAEDATRHHSCGAVGPECVCGAAWGACRPPPGHADTGAWHANTQYPEQPTHGRQPQGNIQTAKQQCLVGQHKKEKKCTHATASKHAVTVTCTPGPGLWHNPHSRPRQQGSPPVTPTRCRIQPMWGRCHDCLPHTRSIHITVDNGCAHGVQHG